MCRLLQCIAMCMPHLTQVVLCCADLIQHRCKDAENFWTKLFWCTHHLTIHSHITQVSLVTHLTHRRESPHTGVRMERPHTGVSRHSQIKGWAYNIWQYRHTIMPLLCFFTSIVTGRWFIKASLARGEETCCWCLIGENTKTRYLLTWD